MSEPDRFELRLRMDATVTVFDHNGQPTDWIKPGSEASMSWRGVPSQEELMLRYNDLTSVISATLEDVLGTVRERVERARRGE